MAQELERIRDYVFNNKPKEEDKEPPKPQKTRKIKVQRMRVVADEIFSEQEEAYEEDYSGDVEAESPQR